MTRPTPRSLLIPLTLACLGVTALGWAQSQRSDSGIVERTQRRLAQIDVSVTGPADAVVGLTAADFDLVIAGDPIEDVTVDAICNPPSSGGDAEQRPSPDAAPADTPAENVEPTVTPTYLFYFDQHHLTPAGRQNSLEYARELVDRLIPGGEDGPRAMIVSAGERLVTFAEPTGDPAVLLEALDRLEHDRRQWDPYPYGEDQRIQEIVRAIAQGDAVEQVAGIARRHQREEAWHTDKALRLFSFVLGRLEGADPPKIAVYFADTMRREPGAHYLSFVAGGDSEFNGASNTVRAMELSAFGSSSPFDRMIETAAAHGIRVYPVEGRGLTTISSTVGSPRPGNASPVANRRGMNDAEDSLTSLALETGGRAFINGVPARKMAAAIREDLGCVYLLSFDATGLREDAPLSVRVRVSRPEVTVKARGQVVIHGEAQRSLARLMAAYAGGSGEPDAGALHVAVMPGTFEDGVYRALAQVALPPSPLADSTWEVGTITVSGDRVLDETTRTVTVSRADVPIVVERMLDFRPGPFELIAVAREGRTGRVVSARVEGEWPKSLDRAVFLGPFATVQPRQAAFVRDDAVHYEGALGAGEGAAVRPELPTAVIVLVCRGSSRSTAFTLDRSLVGAREVTFDPLEIELGSDRCIQVRDVIPADTMTAGAFSYDIRASHGGREVGSASFPFYVLDESGAAANAAVGR